MVLAALLLPLIAKVNVTSDIVYGKAGEFELKLDLYRPSVASTKPVPVIVVLHGGAWMAGKKEDMAALSQKLAESGFAAATVNYRLAPKYKYPAMLDDAQQAVRFLRSKAKEYNFDTAHFGAAGASAGGHLSLLVGSIDAPKDGQSSKVQAVLNLFGPTDMRRDFPATLDILYAAVLGKPRKDAGEEIKKASPIFHLTSKSAPTFTIHGEADPLVPVAQAKWLEENLTKLKIEHDMVLIPKMGHELPVEKPEVKAALDKGIAFLKAKLMQKN